jgi:hypothetical protein
MQKLSPQSNRPDELSKLPFKESNPTHEEFSVGQFIPVLLCPDECPLSTDCVEKLEFSVRR